MLTGTSYPNNSRVVSGSVSVRKDDLVLLCNTSSSAVTIELQEIQAGYFPTQYRLYVKDNSGNASVNNITIVAPSGYKINNASSVVLNVNNQSAEIIISSNIDYLLSIGSSSSSSGITSVLLGARNIFVSKSGNPTTAANADIAHTYLTITAAVAAAVLLTPSAANPINIITYPGVYAESFTIPSYVNLISATSPEFMFSAAGWGVVNTKTSNALGQVYVNGTITQSGDYVKIVGINCNTLAINSTSTNSSYSNIVASTSITSNQAEVAGSFYDVHSQKLLSDVNISATMCFCTGGDGSFAGSTTGNAANISGTLSWCIGAAGSFSSTSYSLANAGNISGRLVDCISIGDYSYCSVSSGVAGTISGTLINCRGLTYCYGSAGTNGTCGTISGTMQNCYGQVYSYVSGVNSAGTISGRLMNCVSVGSVCFASSNSKTISGGLISSTAILTNCICTTWGSFCSNIGSGTEPAGTIAGRLIGCVARDHTSFASSYDVGGGTISGTIIDCIGTAVAFGACGDSGGITLNGTGGTISGTVQNCVASGGNTFCNGLTPGTISGSLIGCNAATDTAFSSVNLTGKLIRCRAKNSAGAAIRVTSDAIIEYCDLKGNPNSVVSNSGSAAVVDIRHSNLFGGGVDANVTILTATPYNTDDSSSLF